MDTIYLDHAATTPVHPEVVEAMMPYLTTGYGNPSSIHRLGQEARRAVDEAREAVAALIGAQPEEIYFTSGGTEADNFALRSYLEVPANTRKGNHVITSRIEHEAVLKTCEYLEARGIPVTYVGVDSEGIVDLDQLADAITDQTTLVSVMLANNEVGTIQPIEQVREIIGDRRIALHTDAVQAVGDIPVDVGALGADMLSLSGHKMYGPKGIGALYIRHGTRINAFLFGGGHERGKRGGTENVPGIVGLGKAAEIVLREGDSFRERLRSLRDRFISAVEAKIDGAILNGHRSRRHPQAGSRVARSRAHFRARTGAAAPHLGVEHRLNKNASFCFRDCEGDVLLMHLDERGICASSGSACSSGAIEPSHVLEAMGVPPEIAHGVVRFTFGRDNTEEQIDRTVDALAEIVPRIRAVSQRVEHAGLTSA